MRIFFSVPIAFLFTILAAGIIWAHSMDQACHENKPVHWPLGAREMAICCCSPGTEAMSGDSEGDIRTMADCCPLEQCGKLLFTKEVVLGSTVSPAEFSGVAQSPVISQPMPWALIGGLRTGLPPPQLPSTPRYIQNCSFLI